MGDNFFAWDGSDSNLVLQSLIFFSPPLGGGNITKSDINNFRKAQVAASLSDYEKTRVGCVAIYQGQTVGVGCNTNKTHPRQEYYNRFREHDKDSNYFQAKLHGEINCLNSIRHMNIDFSKVKLYIYRIRKDQPYGIARPCPACMAAIRDLGIKNVYYTTNDGFAYEKIVYKPAYERKKEAA